MKTKRVAKKEVRHIAKLARLTLSDDDTAQYLKDLNAILDYVDMLNIDDTL